MMPQVPALETKITQFLKGSFPINLAKKQSAESIKHQARKNKKVEPKFQTRQTSYSNKVMVKVDSKTWIYVDINTNPKKEILKYQSLHKLRS